MTPAEGHKGEEKFGFKRKKYKGELIAIYIYIEGKHGEFTLSNGQMPTQPQSHSPFTTDQ